MLDDGRVLGHHALDQGHRFPHSPFALLSLAELIQDVGQTPSRERELVAELRIVMPAPDEILLEGQCPADALERVSGLAGTHLELAEVAQAAAASTDPPSGRSEADQARDGLAQRPGPVRLRAQALAVMDHPHIARVLDAGTTSGGRPFFVDEMLRVIREDEPPTPSSRISTSEALPTLAAGRQVEPAWLSRLVRGELDWIVMKALSKERERRYASAVGLADDLERHLNHEPVSAGPPTAAYRVSKFVRRNRRRS